MKQIKITFNLAEAAIEQLRKLSEATRISQSDYFREAVDDLLRKYSAQLQEIARKRK